MLINMILWLKLASIHHTEFHLSVILTCRQLQCNKHLRYLSKQLIQDNHLHLIYSTQWNYHIFQYLSLLMKLSICILQMNLDLGCLSLHLTMPILSTHVSNQQRLRCQANILQLDHPILRSKHKVDNINH